MMQADASGTHGWIKPSWLNRDGADARNKAGSPVSEMTKSFCSLLWKREEVFKKSLNGKFRETETEAPLGFRVVCVTAGDWYLLLEALDLRPSLVQASDFTFTPWLVTPGIPVPCSLSLVPWWACGSQCGTQK